jgi:predicted dienelactone hydrolase
MVLLRLLVPIVCLGGVAMAHAADPPYDPLAVEPPASLPAPLDLEVTDDSRDRKIPVRVWLPSDGRRAPVIVFSHGLGGARDGNAYLGRHWSGRGFCVVFLQHAGSDEAVWRDLPFPERLPALRKAVNLSTTLDRYRDVPAVLDRLAAWNDEAGGPLEGRLDPDRIGIAGHSFGAVTAQGVCGQRTADGRTPFTDRRIGAALLMSPSLPRIGDGTTAFGGVTVPWMIMTGTEDDSPVGNATPESRREVFASLPAGEKYELVLFQGEHQAFGDRVLPGSKRPRDPNHHRVVLALSTAFFEAFLRGDAAALAWLESDAPRSVLAEGDLWQWK